MKRETFIKKYEIKNLKRFPIKKLLAMLVIITVLLTIQISCQKTEQIAKDSGVENYLNEANKLSLIHDSAISFAYHYPNFLKLNKWQRGDVARSYLKINKIQEEKLIKYYDLENIYNNVDFKDVNSVTKYLEVNKLATNNVIRYVKYIYATLSDKFQAETTLKLMDEYLEKVKVDNELTSEEKRSIIIYITITKNSAVNWRSLLLSAKSNSLAKSTVCNDCLGNNWGWLAAADGLGGIFGIFVGSPLEGAILLSAGATCEICPMCCDGTQDPYYNYPPCCPNPYYFDGANCYLFSPPAGSNPFVQNGNFYWDDPSHTCVPPGPPAFWDLAHCCYPVGRGYFLFVYNGGFYIKCSQ